MLLLTAISFGSSAQNVAGKVKLFDAWYYVNPVIHKPVHVFTYEFADSTVTIIARNRYKVGFEPKAADLSVIRVKDINTMMFRRKKSIGIGILAGSITGALIGGLIGYSNGDDPESSSVGVSAGAKAFSGVVIGGIIGAGAGLTFGSFKNVIKLNSDVGSRYEDKKPVLMKYSIRYYTH